MLSLLFQPYVQKLARYPARHRLRRTAVVTALALATFGALGAPVFADPITTVPSAVDTVVDAHLPSFAISADDVVVRTIAPAPAIIAAPFYTQFDGSIWAESNCGPTSLAMALGAFQVNASPLALRDLANNQMGMSNPNVGTSWESLAYAAQQNGMAISGLYPGDGRAPYRTWTLDDLAAQLSQGHPVLLLTRYWDLPGNAASRFAGDHYILALGFNADGNLVYNDPAASNGANRAMSPTQLLKAWSDVAVGQPRSAMAVYR